MKHRITPLQLSLITFCFLFGGSLLAHTPARAESGALLAALGGIALGLVYLCFLSALSRRRASPPRPLCLLYALLFLLLFTLSLADFGTFWNSQIMPTLPPAIAALSLLLLSLYAVSRGMSAIGRYGECLIPILIPLLLILLPGLIGGDPARLLPGGKEALLQGAKGSFFVFLSTFGDTLALALLSPALLSPQDQDASVFARAGAAAGEDLFPTLRGKGPKSLKGALLFGAIPASILFLLTTAAARCALPAHAQAQTPYPLAKASTLLHEGIFSPLFLLLLSLLYTVRVMVLLIACASMLAPLLPSPARPHVPHALCAAVSFFLAALPLLPRLALSARESLALLLFLIFSELILPFFDFLLSFLPKRLDQNEKT